MKITITTPENHLTTTFCDLTELLIRAVSAFMLRRGPVVVENQSEQITIEVEGTA